MADYLQEAKDNYKDAKDYVREQYERIREDFEFSNPSEPRQWSDIAITARVGRPTHTLDRTNKYVQHVVNKLREAKTSADILPVDSGADPKVAEKIKAIFRHIEYTSRADIAWDTATDHQARGGLGWVRITPRVTDPETNEQDIIFQRVHDPLSCLLEAGWTEPDGTDAMCAFIETSLTNKQFEKQFGKKTAKENWDSDGWFQDDSVRICEYFKVHEDKIKKKVIDGPDGKLILTEDEYAELVANVGFEPPIVNSFTAKKRRITWCKLSGEEILEETEFPSQYIGLVPVIGHELWVEGKRYLCGLVRRLMDGQRLHNMEMSALTEALMIQPKAPFLVSSRAIDGYEEQWQKLASGQPAYLTFNDIDEQGQPVSTPSRLTPPNFPIAYANMAQLAVQEMEESVGMPKATFGQQSNAVSGRAKLADQEASSTATFHFADNRKIAQTQAYRVALDMLPRIYDSRRQARILGEDGEQGTIEINPGMKSPSMVRGGKVVAINPGVGRYDVRVKVGPGYSTIREELGVKLQEMSKGNPMFATALTPILMELENLPEADKVMRIAMSMLPPEVQKAYADEEVTDIPAPVKAQLDAQGKQIEQMAAAMDQAGTMIKELNKQLDEKNAVVKTEAKAAMTEIQAAKKELEAKATQIDSKEKLMDREAKIVQLELQLGVMKAKEEIEDEREKANEEIATNQDDAAEEGALNAMAKALESGQQAIAKALAQNTKALAEMQIMTVEALEELADAAGATRKITLEKGKDGTTVGATSVAIMPTNETLQ
jgi:hypothetical protein